MANNPFTYSLIRLVCITSNYIQTAIDLKINASFELDPNQIPKTFHERIVQH